MPHATTDSMPTANGDRHSQFLEHLKSYPVVSDGIETFKTNPYGKKSLELADSAYTKFAKPVEPYLETPYSYARPYVAKADELADSGLDRVDEHFPIVKEDTNTIVDKGKSIFWWPFKVADDGKNYVVGTWNDEYSKTASHNNRGAGVTTFIMAVISTELKLASDFFQAAADYVRPRYEESKQRVGDLAQRAHETVEEHARHGQKRAHEAHKTAEEKTKEVAHRGEEKTKEVAHHGEEKKEQAKKEVHHKTQK